MGKDLSELLERVDKASDELSLADDITLWCMSAGCALVEHRSGERGLDGYWVYHLLVEDASGRKNVLVPEWQLPGRSIDAALALVERMLPGWTIARMSQGDNKLWTVELREGYLTSYGRVVIAPGHWNGTTPPLAILAALLTALRSKIETGT